MRKYCIAILLLLLPLVGVYAQDDSLTYQIVRHPESGILMQSIHPVYDSRDRLAVEVCYYYGENGMVEKRALQSFDRHASKLRREEYTADDELLFVEIYRWYRNKDGESRRVRMFRTIQYEEDGTVTRSTYRYYYFMQKKYIFLNGKLIYSAKTTEEQQ